MDARAVSLDAFMRLGDEAAGRDEFDEALAAYEQALDIDYVCPPAVAGKIRALNGLERYAEAWEVGRWALIHSSQYVVPSLCAEALHGLRRDEDALTMIDRACWLGPREANFHRLRGAILFGLSRDEEAVTAHEKAIASFEEARREDEKQAGTGDGFVRETEAELQRARERASLRAASLELVGRRRIDHPEDVAFWAEVVGQLREIYENDLADALEARPEREQFSAAADVLFKRVSVATTRDHPEVALQYYERVLEIDPERVDAIYGRAQALYAVGRPQEALDMVALIPGEVTVNHSSGWFARGQILRANGQLCEALECYGRAIEYGPWMEPWRREQAALLTQMGREDEARGPLAQAELFSGLGKVGSAGRMSFPHLYVEAVSDFDSALRLDPGLRFAEGEAAGALVRLGRHEEALARLERALAEAPRDVYLLVVKGFALIGAEKPDEALEVFEQSLAVEPRGIGWTGKATALARLERDAEAIDAVKEALSLDDEDEAAWVLWGALLEKVGDYEDALGAMNAALEWERLLSLEDHVSLERIQVSTARSRHKQLVDRDDRLALYRAKVAVLRQVGREEAADELASQLAFREAQMHVQSAQGFVAQERYEEAVAEYRRALALYPGGSGDAWLALGNALVALGREDEALDAFQHALDGSAGHMLDVYNRANTLANAHRLGQAEAVLDLALAVWPAQGPWWHLSSLRPKEDMEAHLATLKGKILSETDRYEEALPWVEHAVAIMPDLHFARRQLGRVLTQLRRWDESAEEFARCLDLGDAEAYDWHSLAYALYKGVRYDEALRAIERAIELDPSPPIVGTKGEIYQKLGEHELALEWLDRALNAEPTDREHWAVKAEALRALGRESEARAAELRAVGRYAPSPPG